MNLYPAKLNRTTMNIIPVLLFSYAVVGMPPEEKRSHEIEVLEKIADLALVPPKLNTSPLPEYDYDKLDYGMTIGIERTPGGRLWACWVAGGDSPKAFFVLATSDDDGETWSPPCLVVDSHSKDLPAERIHVCSICGNTFVGEEPDNCPVCGAPKSKFIEVD